MTEFDIYLYGIPIVLALIFLEVTYSTIYGLKLYNLRDTLAGLGLLVGNFVIGLLTKSSIFLLYVYVYQFKIIIVNDLMPFWLVWVITFITIDFIYYWYHRMSHRVRFMWAVHMNHHSSEEMNLTVSLRQAWFGPITKVPFFVLMPLVGFDPIITAIAGVASTLWGVIGHTQWIRRLGPFEYIFVTPSSHRVHHGSNESYIDKNYGNLLIIWDRLFGTFAEEIEQVKFGIKDNVKTFNPIKITFMFWQQMVSDFKQSTSIKAKFLSFFGKPEWKP